jgi:hypothetical protein
MYFEQVCDRRSALRVAVGSRLSARLQGAEGIESDVPSRPLDGPHGHRDGARPERRQGQPLHAGPRHLSPELQQGEPQISSWLILQPTYFLYFFIFFFFLFFSFLFFDWSHVRSEEEVGQKVP